MPHTAAVGDRHRCQAHGRKASAMPSIATDPSEDAPACSTCTTAEAMASAAPTRPSDRAVETGQPRDRDQPRDRRRRHESCDPSPAQCVDADFGTPSAGFRSKKPTGLSVKPA